MNFPSGLAIRPSDPKAALACFTFNPDEEWLTTSQNADIESYGIAGRIWEAAYAMALYLQPPHNWEFEPQCSVSRECLHGAIVELGSGSGFLGLHLARLLSLRPDSFASASKSLILTDLEAVCPLLHRNTKQASKDLCGVDLVVRPLEWGNLDHGNSLATALMAGKTGASGNPLLSHIICSDLVYFPELLAPLLRTLLQLSSPPFSTAAQPVQIIISYMIRSLTTESQFWSAFGMWFNFTPALLRQNSDSAPPWERFGSQNGGYMFVFVAKRKPESLGWPVPNDSDLMKGSDETFETLMLMKMAAE